MLCTEKYAQWVNNLVRPALAVFSREPVDWCATNYDRVCMQLVARRLRVAQDVRKGHWFAPAVARVLLVSVRASHHLCNQ